NPPMAIPIVYFPVKVPHVLPGSQPELGMDGVGTTCLEVDTERKFYLDAKLASPLRGPHRLPGGDDAEAIALQWLQETIVEEHPNLLEESGRGQRLDTLVDAIQEDLVIMYRAAGVDADQARALYLHVAFPTGWCPACAVGRTFLEIHHPVPKLDA